MTVWLEHEVSAEDVRFRLAELLLRFAFMDGNIHRSAIIRFLDRLAQELAIYVGELHTKFKEMSSEVPALHTGFLAFELGIRSMETQLAWAREARARLGEKPP